MDRKMMAGTVTGVFCGALWADRGDWQLSRDYFVNRCGKLVGGCSVQRVCSRSP